MFWIKRNCDKQYWRHNNWPQRQKISSQWSCLCNECCFYFAFPKIEMLLSLVEPGQRNPQLCLEESGVATCCVLLVNIEWKKKKKFFVWIIFRCFCQTLLTDPQLISMWKLTRVSWLWNKSCQILKLEFGKKLFQFLWKQTSCYIAVIENFLNSFLKESNIDPQVSNSE